MSWFSDRYDTYACGGEGRCGYNTLAAGLALRAKKTWNDFKDKLVPIRRTVRHDLFCHLKGHALEYKELFVPDPSTTEAKEGGAPPYLLGSLLECCY